MEGVAVTVDDVRRILAGDPLREVSPGDVALVRGYRDAMTFVLRRADDQNFEWNRELVVGVHDRVLPGRFEDGAGRLRTGPSHIVELRTGGTIFEPPAADRVPELVDELCSELGSMDLHPALAAAWFHVSFAAIHPFVDGNGRTARVLASLFMYRGGVVGTASSGLLRRFRLPGRAVQPTCGCHPVSCGAHRCTAAPDGRSASQRR